jgi:hypothetical protein
VTPKEVTNDELVMANPVYWAEHPVELADALKNLTDIDTPTISRHSFSRAEVRRSLDPLQRLRRTSRDRHDTLARPHRASCMRCWQCGTVLDLR